MILVFLAEAALPKLVWRHESETVGLMSVQAVRLPMPRPVTTPQRPQDDGLHAGSGRDTAPGHGSGGPWKVRVFRGPPTPHKIYPRPVGNNQQTVTCGGVTCQVVTVPTCGVKARQNLIGVVKEQDLLTDDRLAGICKPFSPSRLLAD